MGIEHLLTEDGGNLLYLQHNFTATNDIELEGVKFTVDGENKVVQIKIPPDKSYQTSPKVFYSTGSSALSIDYTDGSQHQRTVLVDSYLLNFDVDRLGKVYRFEIASSYLPLEFIEELRSAYQAGGEQTNVRSPLGIPVSFRT